MSANFESSSLLINSLVSVLPEVIHKSRDKTIQEISNINSIDKAIFFKRIAFIIRAECSKTLQEQKNELKNPTKTKKGCFSIFNRKSKNLSVKNKHGAETIFNHELIAFDFLTVLCLKDLSVLPSTTDIESFADESIQLILYKCKDELPQFLENNLYLNLNGKGGNKSPIIWLRRDSSRVKYLGKLEPDYFSEQINSNDQQNSDSGSALVLDKNYNWKSIYSAQQISRVNSKKQTQIDDTEQFVIHQSEDTATTYIEKSEDQKNKLKEKLEKVINKNVIPLEEAHLKMCQFIKDTDYGLNNGTNTSSKCEEHKETHNDNESFSSSSIDNTILHNDILSEHKSSDSMPYNEMDESSSVETNSKNAKSQSLQSDDIPQNETKKFTVKNNLHANEAKNTSIKNYKVQQNGHFMDNDTPRYPIKNKKSPENLEEKKKNYNRTLEKGKAILAEKKQKVLQNIQQKEKRDKQRRSEQLSEHEQKMLKLQQAVGFLN